jgi:ribonuclease HI
VFDFTFLYFLVLYFIPVHSAPAAQSTAGWQQPPFGYLKCNVDASFYNLAGSTGWDWVLRDSSGEFKLAGTNIVNTPFSVLEGEAMALVEAMKEVIQRGLQYVVFESDSKTVVDAISSHQSGVSEFSLLISYIQSLLTMHNYFEVKYVRRQANKVAHHLARAAFSMSRRRIFDSIPPCIDSYLQNEKVLVCFFKKKKKKHYTHNYVMHISMFYYP